MSLATENYKTIKTIQISPNPSGHEGTHASTWGVSVWLVGLVCFYFCRANWIVCVCVCVVVSNFNCPCQNVIHTLEVELINTSFISLLPILIPDHFAEITVRQRHSGTFQLTRLSSVWNQKHWSLLIIVKTGALRVVGSAQVTERNYWWYEKWCSHFGDILAVPQKVKHTVNMWHRSSLQGIDPTGMKTYVHTKTWTLGDGGSRGRWYMYNYGWFAWLYGRNHHTIIKEFSSS